MNTKKVLLALSLSSALLLGGCGGKKSSDYSKYIKLGDYKGITVDRVVTTITDEDVQDEIQNNLAMSAEYTEVSDRGAQNGDSVTIDLVTTIDGTEAEEFSGEDMELELGTEMLIDGFDAELTGMKAGETKQFTLTFPTPYDGEVDGKEASFSATVKAVYEVSLPEYNDEYVAEITDSEYLTTAEYETYLKDMLQSTADDDSQSMAYENALLTVVENTSFDGYPQELFDSTKESLKAEYQSFAEALGLDDASELYGDESDLDTYVTEEVNTKMVVYAIAAKEKLTVTDEEYEDALSMELLDSDYETVEDLKKDIDEESYRYDLLYQKVLNFLGQNCTFNDVDADEYYAEDEELFLDDEDAGADDIVVTDEDAAEEDMDITDTEAETDDAGAADADADADDTEAVDADSDSAEAETVME